MVKDHPDSERGNPLPPHELQGLFYVHHPTDRITHTTTFVTPVVEHWLERKIAQWVPSFIFKIVKLYYILYVDKYNTYDRYL